MYHHADSAMFSYSETSARNFQATPPATVIVPHSSHLQSPSRFYSSETPESGSISSTGSSSATPTHTNTCYNYPPQNDGQSSWTFSTVRNPYGDYARPRSLENHLGLSFAPTGYIGDPRNRLDQNFPRIRTVEVVFTDDAGRKPGEGVHRWCFNCRATDTTTWRRSSLSPGKLLCNRCGLFERSHRAPRPEKFPRRRRARPTSVSTTPAFSGEQWQYQNHLSSTAPLTHSFQPLDAVGGQSTPLRMSWMTQNVVGPSPPPATGGRCYPTSHGHQQAIYRGDGQM